MSSKQDYQTYSIPSSPLSLASRELTASASVSVDGKSATVPSAAATPASPPPSPSTQPTKPSLRLLFSSLTIRHAPLLTLAMILSLVSGALPPIMSRILGQLFDAYTAYNPSGLPASALSAEAKATLMHKITMGVWHLALVGVGVLVLSTAMISTWIVIGETVASRLRRRVYVSVSQRKMEWFDLGAGVENDEEDESGEKSSTDDTASSSLGAGGLMAKFSRETDDVRLATSQYSGQLLQYLTTCLACLILALVSCWSLALVILASIPVTIVVTGAVEQYTVSHLATERAITAKASSLVERVALSIATVKAFDAEAREVRRFNKLLDVGSKAYKKVSLAWGIRLGVSSFLTFSMFVQGFWYGSHLVQAGKTTPGTVFTVFSACLIASQHLQLIIQTLQIVEKGKISALGLEKLMHVDEASSSRGGAKRSASIRRKPSAAAAGHGGTAARVMRLEDIPSSPLKSAHSDSGFSRHGHGRSASLHTLTSPNPNRRRFRDHHGGGGGLVSMRKIRPETRCLGEINLTNVSFTYPSVKKAAAAAQGEEQTMTLQGVNVFIPAGEATFIVGGSGSGKSTIAQLLLRLYRPDSGTIEVDDRDVRFLDPEWFRAQIASVDQHPIVFDLSVHDNVALGLSGRAHELKPGSVTYTKDHVPVVPRSEVEQACRTALLHEFVKGLPDGYDTILGTRGSSLSGGQKQRLAIARARLRDPPILILDEATSALDPTSRLLINEAVKTWRKGRTTIIITHDLSQVEAGDFLYMMKQGQVVENGYREDLERSGASGLFRELAEQQREQAEEERLQRYERDAAAKAAASPSSSSWALSTPKLARLASGTPSPNEQVEELVELLPRRSTLSYRSPVRDTTRSSEGLGLASPSRRSTFRYNPAAASSDRDLRRHGRQPSSDSLKTVGSAYSSTSDLVADKSSTPVRISNDDPTLSDRAGAKGLRTLRLAEQQHAWVASRDAPWLEDAGKVAASLRSQPSSAPASIRTRKVWSEDDLNKSVAALKDLHIDLPTTKSNAAAASAIESAEAILSPPAPLWPTLRFALATTPRKPLLILGLICSILSGALTPLFSFFLGKLLATMGLQGQSHNVLVYALFVLCLAVLEGIFSFGNFYTMEVVGEAWIQKLRGMALRKVVRQDKTWFDTAPDAKPGTLVARTIQDAEDARNLLARQIGALLIVLIMVLAGITWAMITGWQLTLVGLAVGPIFIAAMTMQSSVVSRFEVKNKARRETVAKSFYEVVSNIRGVRSMALEGIFASQFDDALQATTRDAFRAAPFSGFGFGLGEALTYMCEALLFYVGALFITKGIYDFERMVVVFNLFIFAVSFAAMTMAYLPGLTKALQATADLRRLVELGEEGGSERVKVGTPQQLGQQWQGQEAQEQEQGHIVFKDVSFKYPSRPNVPVLTSASFSVQRGEKVAIVGPSGCGKSTIAALLQRLYEPSHDDEGGNSAGGIYLDGHRIDSLPTTTLRHRLAVISQHPNLFDMSVEENVEYGLPDDEARTDGVATSAAIRAACSLAQSSSFIAALPKGYGTQLGDAASLVSGGQKQRLAIARALLRFLPQQGGSEGRRASVLILDEATSALDDVTRAAVLDVVLPTKRSSNSLLASTTVLAVTHKLDEMKRCDRIVVLEEGKVVQQGSFEELMQVKGGAFRTLASAGEWGA